MRRRRRRRRRNYLRVSVLGISYENLREPR
jgi:hypothetical protein